MLLNTFNCNIWTLCYFIYVFVIYSVQLEFNSHLTDDPRSTEITDDNSPNLYPLDLHYFY